MNAMANRRVLLGVTGGIAAYKSPDLVRRLRERGCDVRVVMTRAAQEFIAPLSLQAVSGHRVHTTLLDPEAEAAMGHIELARWADVIVIAPASADIIARLALGLADDLLSTLCLASAAPVIVAPAMNRQMWAAAATRANVATLEARGVLVMGPGAGDQACGEIGEGRMLEPTELAARIENQLGGAALEGLRVLITAGPTREPVDPVRFISNHSSGKMGYAVAGAARAAGAAVTLVSGPCALEAPAGVERVMVETAAEMHDAVMQRAPASDIFIAAAAVADYRPAAAAAHKIKKSDDTLSISLVRNPDILADVAALEHRPFTVGFAAETRDLESNARGKLERKGVDMIAANVVGSAELGFGADRNALRLLWRDGGTDLGEDTKGVLARRLVTLVAERYRAAHPA